MVSCLLSDSNTERGITSHRSARRVSALIVPMYSRKWYPVKAGVAAPSMGATRDVRAAAGGAIHSAQLIGLRENERARSRIVHGRCRRDAAFTHAMDHSS